MLRIRRRKGRRAAPVFFAGLPFGFAQGKKACASTQEKDAGATKNGAGHAQRRMGDIAPRNLQTHSGGKPAERAGRRTPQGADEAALTRATGRV